MSYLAVTIARRGIRKANVVRILSSGETLKRLGDQQMEIADVMTEATKFIAAMVYHIY